MTQTLPGVATRATPDSVAPESVAPESVAPESVAPESVAGVPGRAEGVELLGELDGSGYREPPCLARRADGQTIQLTGLLYQVLEAIDGRRDLDGIARVVSERIGKQATPDDIRFLVEKKLRPLGLLKEADGSDPEVKKANPLLALRFRLVLSGERATRRLTAPFAALFHPLIVLAVLGGFIGVVGWLLFVEGIGGGARQTLYQPALVVLMFVLAAASAAFHEFGHAAALRYSGGTPGVMGAGLYLVWPAFYTDVTDSYRLARSGRLRTDLGGLYFNMVFAVAVFGVWAATGFDALLVVIPLLLFQMVQQLLPLVRLDGYHILADVTGVPDLFARIKPTLQSFKPGTGPDPRVTALKPWVRVVITGWVLAVVPLLALSLLFAVVNLPRLAATAWDSLALQWQSIGAARHDGDPFGMAAGALSIAALCLPALSSVYVLGRVARRAGRAAGSATAGRPVLRTALGVAGLAAMAGLVWIWWPNGEYRPLQRGERARVQDTVRATAQLPTGRPGLTEVDAARLNGAPFQSGIAGTAPATAPADTVPTTTTTIAGDRAVTTTTGASGQPLPSTTTTTRRATTTTTATTATSTGPSTTTTTGAGSTTTTGPSTTESTSP
jgi:putative peptide zinc metalloprotease protein